jgi:hypothetical protein
MFKRFYFILLALTAILISAFVLASCSEKNEGKENNANAGGDTKTEYTDEELREMFKQSRLEAELCYFSFFGREGFDSYLYAFPDSWIEAFCQGTLLERDVFFDKTESSLTTIAEERKLLYGDTFEAGYAVVKELPIEGAALDTLKTSLSASFVDPDSVTNAVEVFYSLAYFADETKETVLYESTVNLVLIELKDDGWFVSPQYYISAIG